MFEITKDNTPILNQQPQAVKDAAVKAVSEYTSKKSVAIRSGWGSFLEPIKNGQLNLVDVDGQPIEGDSHKKTWSAICREMGIPRSSADRYIDEYLACKVYPDAIQEVAAREGLNLALTHVMDKWVELTAPGGDLEGKDLSRLTPYEVKGIVSDLEQIKAQTKTTKTRETPKVKFQRLLKEALAFAREEKITSEFITATLESEIAASFGMPGAKVTREKAPIYDTKS